MTAGRFLGLGRDAAARFAFLMSLPITAGALVFRAVDVAGEGGVPDGFIAPFAWGIVASGINGWVAVWGTLKLIRTRTFPPFVVYRILLGVAVPVLHLAGLIRVSVPATQPLRALHGATTTRPATAHQPHSERRTAPHHQHQN